MQNCWDKFGDFAEFWSCSTPHPSPDAQFSFWHYCCFSGRLLRPLLAANGLRRRRSCVSLSFTHPAAEKFLQPLVKNRISSMDILEGLEILLSGECSRGGVRLPRWVLEGKKELPHVAGMTSSLCTGPPFHMRSNPPTLFSLPVNLRRKQHSVRVRQEINAN